MARQDKATGANSRKIPVVDILDMEAEGIEERINAESISVSKGQHKMGKESINETEITLPIFTLTLKPINEVIFNSINSEIDNKLETPNGSPTAPIKVTSRTIKSGDNDISVLD
nr:hypothetical protein CFP56_26534 [Quercus suber]